MLSGIPDMMREGDDEMPRIEGWGTSKDPQLVALETCWPHWSTRRVLRR